MKYLLAVVALVAALGSAEEAHAQWGWMGNGQWYGRNVYTVYDQDRLPYFALHPPVYYSRPVPRTYGYSPFAYSGDVMTPELPAVEPEVLMNPYYDGGPKGGAKPAPQMAPPVQKPTSAPRSATPVRPGQKQAAGSDRSAAVQPLRIVNPHVGKVYTVSR
ncbi:MAG: hypothetical protein JNL96_09940 [Planctomycetaceae bacterium]|nr:hypothetical protein [Planctomycetaceae bacterium]